VRWLRDFIVSKVGYSLLLYSWSTSPQPQDLTRRCLVRDVLMPNKRYCTVVFWLDNPDSPQPPQETPCTNSDLPSTFTSTTKAN
jgi:hypothetical protein